MKILSLLYKLKPIILAAVLFTVIAPGYTQADEYKWLKTNKYEKIFVYTDFSECDLVADKINESIKRILLHSGIRPTISSSLVFQTTDRKDQSAKELIDQELTADHKIILYVYGKCIEYNSVYIYQFDVRFAVINNKYSLALLYSSPQHSVMGADTIRGIDRTFRKLFEEAVEDYLTANKAKSK